jgi:hypothetical protein
VQLPGQVGVLSAQPLTQEVGEEMVVARPSIMDVMVRLAANGKADALWPRTWRAGVHDYAAAVRGQEYPRSQLTGAYHNRIPPPRARYAPIARMLARSSKRACRSSPRSCHRRHYPYLPRGVTCKSDAIASP